MDAEFDTPATALDGRPRRGAESSERHVVAPTGRWRAMLRAYTQARLVGYSRFESVRVTLLVGRLSLRDAPTDTWGGRLQTACAGCDRAARQYGVT